MTEVRRPDKKRSIRKTGWTGYRCSRCQKRLPSIEAANAHIDKRRGGEGFITWHHYPEKRA